MMYIPQPWSKPVRNKIVDLLNQRRYNVMEMMQTKDPIAKATLAAHIAQLDVDITKQTTVQIDEATDGQFTKYREAMQELELEETTQVIPTLSMHAEVYGEK